MIDKKITEQQYRLLNRDSYSSLKEFAEDRRKYYKKYVLKAPQNSEVSQAMELGSLADCMIFEREKFDEKFRLSSVSKPAGIMGKFTDKVLENTLRNTNNDGVLTRSLEDILETSYDHVKYDRDGNTIAFKRKNSGSIETVVASFLKGDGYQFYKEQREALRDGKTLVNQSDVLYAEKVVRVVRSNPKVHEILSIVDSDRYDTGVQVPILFDYNGLEMKSLVDRLIIDHREGKISVYDLKTSWNVDDFLDESFIKYRYYIQATVYNRAAESLQKEMGLDYEVIPMQFIVCDSKSECSPQIYKVDEAMLRRFKEEGFDRFGYYYKGTDLLIEELKFHKEKNIWMHSKAQYESEFEPKVISFPSPNENKND